MKKYFLSLTIFLLLLFIVFRSLIFNITTNLVAWGDTSLSVWIMYQNFTKISNLDFYNYFDTNIYYPNKNTLLFSDITLPQVILALFPYLLTQKLILSFNIIFLLTFVLNFASIYLFWKQIFKKHLIALFGSLFFTFSPYFYLEFIHLPEITYWPFFLTLYLLFKQKKNDIKTPVLAGLGITIQFLAGVYLAVLLIFCVFVFYLLKLIPPVNLKSTIIKAFLIFFAFFLTSGIFIKGYIDIKNFYKVKRAPEEYVFNSAHLSDYLFTKSIDSTIHGSLLNSWNRFNKTQNNLFPGFLVLILAITALFKISKVKQSFLISIQLNKQKFYFFFLIVTGFIFSLGPRLNFNGAYNLIPLPYNLLLKFIPLLEVIRAPIRWSFLPYLGLTYFSLITLSRLIHKSYYKVVLLLIFFIFVLEYVPLNLQTTQRIYINKDYLILKNICSKDKKVLLELPVTHLNAAPNIREGLTYITTLQLSSTYHKCNLVNGYSGYDLPENLILANTLDNYILNQQPVEFINQLKKRKVDIVKFNQSYFTEQLKPPLANLIISIATQSGIEKVGEEIFILKQQSERDNL